VHLFIFTMEHDRYNPLFIPEQLNHQLINYLRAVQPQISNRMDELGMLPHYFRQKTIDGFTTKRTDSTFTRAGMIILRSNEAALLWHGPSLSADRAREEERNPNVASYMINCIDGRILRALDGYIHSTKSEKAQIGVEVDSATGLLVPSSPEMRQTIANPGKKTLEFVRVHDHCAAMKIFLQDSGDNLWELLSPQERRLVRQANFVSQEHANLVLAELATRRPMENFNRLTHGLEENERMSVITLFNIKRTSLDFINPLIVPTESGFRLAERKEQRRFSTTEIAEMIRKLQGEIKSPNLPEHGKYRHSYIEPAVFEEFSRTLTNLWIGLSEGKIRTEEEQEVSLPSQFSQIRDLAENATRSLYPDLDDDRSRAVTDKMMRAGVREYLLGGESDNDDHHEMCMAGAIGSNYVAKYMTAGQTLRMGLMDDQEVTQRRVVIGTAVMDSHTHQQDSPGIRQQHLLFLSDITTSGVLDLFKFVRQQPDIRDLVDTGRVLLIPARVTPNIVINGIVQEAARELYN
jgi:hypothetical protein